jgi:hypothetical protein
MSNVFVPIDLLIREDVQLAIIAKNVKKDPNYAPYCLRCPGLKRMRVIEPMYWKCDGCGTVADDRKSVVDPVAAAFVAALP